MRAHRPDQRGDAERRWVRGLPQDRLPVGPPAPVPDVREGRLLQRLPEPALAAPLPRFGPPDDPVLRARRGLDVVLPGRALLRARRRVEAPPVAASSAPPTEAPPSAGAPRACLPTPRRPARPAP